MNQQIVCNKPVIASTKKRR